MPKLGLKKDSLCADIQASLTNAFARWGLFVFIALPGVVVMDDMISEYREQLQWVNERIEMVEHENRRTHDLNDAQRLSLLYDMRDGLVEALIEMQK